MVSNSMEHDTVPKGNRRVYALECIMGNQGRMEKNSKVLRSKVLMKCNFGFFIFYRRYALKGSVE